MPKFVFYFKKIPHETIRIIYLTIRAILLYVLQTIFVRMFCTHDKLFYL